MAFSTGAIANLILDLAAEDEAPVSPMKLQKLLYYAHGWYLAIADEPLLNDRIKAWKFGPVIPSIYHEFKEFGNEPIGDVRAKSVALAPVDGKLRIKIKTACLSDDPSTHRARAVVGKVWRTLKGYSAVQLSQMTHQKGSPWDTVWNHQGGDQLGSNKVIPDDLIQEYFKTRMK